MGTHTCRQQLFVTLWSLFTGLRSSLAFARCNAAALSNRKRCSRELWHVIALATAQHRCDARLHRQLRHARQEVGGRQESMHASACVPSKRRLAVAGYIPQQTMQL